MWKGTEGWKKGESVTPSSRGGGEAEGVERKGFAVWDPIGGVLDGGGRVG